MKRFIIQAATLLTLASAGGTYYSKSMKCDRGFYFISLLKTSKEGRFLFYEVDLINRTLSLWLHAEHCRKNTEWNEAILFKKKETFFYVYGDTNLVVYVIKSHNDPPPPPKWYFIVMFPLRQMYNIQDVWCGFPYSVVLVT